MHSTDLFYYQSQLKSPIMPEDETISNRRQRLSLVPRACGACKIRKIRCDRLNPCSNCRTAGISCQQVGSVPDSRPKRDRVSELQEYVAGLEARLAKVERHCIGQDPPSELPKGPSPPISVTSESKIHETSLTTLTELYEGDSSFINQSAQASELAFRTANSETLEAVQTVKESFSRLNSLLRPGVNPQQLSTVSSSGPDPIFEPLPVSIVVAALQRIKSQPSIFLCGYAITDIPLIENLCQRVFFPTQPVSAGHLAAVDGILYFLFREFTILGQSLSKDDRLETLMAQSERNFTNRVESFDILAVPSFENILALTLAVIKAVSQTKPIYYRALLASASSHCQILGYHRETTYQKDRSGYSECKRRLFWTLYIFDRNSCLIFGHAPRIQDHEIDTQLPTVSSDPGQRGWDDWFCRAIKLAKAQGQIYDKLYSVAGLQATSADRKKDIDSLSTFMYKWRDGLEKLDFGQIKFPQILELSRIHWDIMYYSTLTALLRAPPTPGIRAEISSECFQAARLSLHSHLRCFSGYISTKILSESDFTNWVLHNSSFTPFIVIFLHAIASNMLDDIQLLEQVVESIKGCRYTNAGTEKLYQICSTFARLARRIVEARSTCIGSYDKASDSLLLTEGSENVPLSWPETFSELSGQQIDSAEFSGWLDTDMTSILTDWMNGQPPTTDMFEPDISEW